MLRYHAKKLRIELKKEVKNIENKSTKNKQEEKSSLNATCTYYDISN